MNPVRLILLAGALLLLQALIGGTRLVFAFPGFALIALAGALGVFGKRGGFTQPKWYCALTALLVFAWITARALTSPVAFLAWPDLYQVAACLLMYGAFAWFLTDTRERLWIFGLLLVFAMAQFAVGLRQFQGGDDWMLLNLARTPYGRRASGFFVHSIHFAGYLEAIGVIALSQACWSRWRMEARIATGFAAVLCYVGVAISGSRGGYLSVVFSIAVFFLLSLWMLARLDRRKFLIALVAGLVVLAAGGAVATALMNQSQFLRGRLARLNEQFSVAADRKDRPPEARWDVRIYNWQAALDQFRASPLVGTGSGTHLYLGRFFRRPQVQVDPIHAHSDYLELIAEYGAIGGGVMLLFLVAHIFSGLRGVSRILHRDVRPVGESRDDNLALQIGLLSAVAAYLAHSAVDFNMHIPSNALLFAIIFGCLAQPRAVALVVPADHAELGAEAPPPRAASSWPVGAILSRIVLPAVALWLLCSCLWRLPGEYWAEEARKALRDRRFPETIVLLNKAFRYERGNPEAYYYQGEAYRTMAINQRLRTLRRPYFEQAAAAYEAGLKVFPQDENLWVRHGQALDGLQRFGEAETSYLTALQLDPNLGVLYYYYAVHLRRCGREEEAQAQVMKGVPFSMTNLARILQDPQDVRRLPPPEPDAQ